MLDRFLQDPMVAVGFILFVILLGGIYLLNRERAQLQRMKGPRRFQPDWRRTGASGRRKRRRTGSFRPEWNRREAEAGPPEDGDPETGAGAGRPSSDRDSAGGFRKRPSE